MVNVKRIVLDVLKPHQPNALEFSQAIAEAGADLPLPIWVVRFTVSMKLKCRMKRMLVKIL